MIVQTFDIVLFLDQEIRGKPKHLTKCAGADEVGGNSHVIIAVNMASKDVSSQPKDKWPKQVH